MQALGSTGLVLVLPVCGECKGFALRVNSSRSILMRSSVVELLGSGNLSLAADVDVDAPVFSVW